MRLVAHLSDLHFGTADPRVVGALEQELAAQRPDLIAVSGDLTQRARRREFAEARAFFVRLGRPVVATPGNHDLIAFNPVLRLVAPRRFYRSSMAGVALPSFADDELAVLGIDTTERVRWSLNWSGGRIRSGKIAGAQTWSRETADRPTRIVIAHHVAAAKLGKGDPARRPGAHLRALANLASMGIDLVLGGHHHRPDARLVRFGEPHVPALIVIHASTSTSRRTRGVPNSYNLLQIDRDRIECRVRVLHDGGFDDLKVDAFRRLADGWSQ